MRVSWSGCGLFMLMSMATIGAKLIIQRSVVTV